MTIGGANKMMNTQAVKYVGHKEAVQTTAAGGRTYRFPRGEAVTVPTALAQDLLAQPEKFQPAAAASGDAGQEG